jgi:hypothetical protein
VIWKLRLAALLKAIHSEGLLPRFPYEAEFIEAYFTFSRNVRTVRTLSTYPDPKCEAIFIPVFVVYSAMTLTLSKSPKTLIALIPSNLVRVPYEAEFIEKGELIG